MRYNIALIGAGQIGSRHLQGMALSTLPLNIQLIDPSDASLDVAKKRFEEVMPAAHHTLSLHNNITELNVDIDVAIIATSSNVRKAVIEELLATKKVKYLILEKVLFQSIVDYEAISILLTNKGVSTWVNHPRRMQSFYKELKNQIGNDPHINMTVVGNNWGLGCNSLHFLDLYSYITSSKSLSVNTECLDTQILESKRSGFIEFSGSITGNDERGNSYSITSYNTDISPTHILFTTPYQRILIHEGEGADVLVANQTTQWRFEKRETFAALYQSKMSGDLIENLLTHNTCDLPTYSDSAQLHISFISALLQFMDKITDKIHTTCPIT